MGFAVFWRKVRPAAVATIFVVSVTGLIAATALANNTHTVGPSYHGLGSAQDDNYIVHPFINNTSCGECSLILNLYRAPEVVSYGRGTCTGCGHLHVPGYYNGNVDTSPYRECRFYARVYFSGVYSTHSHGHHYFCG